jgi:hypothetical protein
MSQDTVLKSPLDPNYTRHREEERRRRETREWLKQRERGLDVAADAPPVASDQPSGK